MPQAKQENLQAAKRILTAYLERKGLRKTPERFAILEEIYTREDHFDVDELYISMKNKKYRVSHKDLQSRSQLFTFNKLKSYTYI